MHAQPIAQKGIIDLRGVDFNEDQTLPIVGEWEFYWKNLYSSQKLSALEGDLDPDYIEYLTRWGDLPQLNEETHQFGYATLRLKVIVDDNLPSLSLYIPEVYSAFDLYVNDEGFEGNGIVGTTKEDSKPYWRPSSKVAHVNNQGVYSWI